MSSFPGRMKEYPTISIDRFDKENLHARAYFLSHCHKDHMKGLKGPLLKRRLKFSLTVKLYCSFVTKELLLNNSKYGFWEDNIVALELDSPTHIPLIDEATGESEDVVVTLLPAGHCPGSVMFLFEGAGGTVLYTGDFRLAAGDASRMEHLHSGDRVKNFQTVYIDSTFYDPRFYQIPSRETCLSGIRKLVQDWICLSPYHVVWLNCKAAYGYEYLFTNLGETFNLQVHVNSLNMYKKMPDILCHVTTDRATQIHACRHPKDDELFRANRLPCGTTSLDGTPLRIISIKPSTMWFGERSRKTNVIVRMGGSSYRACFSFHSSYSEIKDFLSYIRPVNIYPNVVPLGRTVEEVTDLLKLMCRKHSEHNEVSYKPLGKLKRARIKFTSQGSDSDDELFGNFAMAPSRKKLVVNEVNEHHSPKTSDIEDKELLILPVLEPIVHTSNFMDCTESNDDDEEEYHKEEEHLHEHQLSGDVPTADKSLSGMPPPPSSSDPPPPKRTSPCWSAFFTSEPVPTDESSEVENSQNSQTLSTDYKTSQSPELFYDNESESGHMTSSQSTYVSEAAIEDLSSALQPSRQHTMHTETGLCTPVKTESVSSDTHRNLSDIADHINPISDSQVSSDFDLPQTPGSQTPHPEELRELYKKLAAGEEIPSENYEQRKV